MDFDPKNVALAVGLLIGIVVIVNVGLWAYYRKSNPGQQIKTLGKTARRARAPWEEEDANLKNLNQMVNELRKSQNPDSAPTEETDSDKPDEKRFS